MSETLLDPLQCNCKEEFLVTLYFCVAIRFKAIDVTFLGFCYEFPNKYIDICTYIYKKMNRVPHEKNRVESAAHIKLFIEILFNINYVFIGRNKEYNTTAADSIINFFLEHSV